MDKIALFISEGHRLHRIFWRRKAFTVSIADYFGIATDNKTLRQVSAHGLPRCPQQS
jgi:hypothetical protein